MLGEPTPAISVHGGDMLCNISDKMLRSKIYKLKLIRTFSHGSPAVKGMHSPGRAIHAEEPTFQPPE